MSPHAPTPIERTFDDRADRYRGSNWHLAYAERLVQLAGVEPHTMVVDACTGTGMAARAIARKHPSTDVLGIDISEKMLHHARTEAAREPLANLRFIRADATRLSEVTEGRKPHLIVCSAGLLYLPITETLSSWTSLLTPGGRIAFSSMAAGNPPAARLFRELAASAGIAIEDPARLLGSRTACHEHIQRAGLRTVAIHEETVEFTPSDLDDAWAVHERLYVDELAVLEEPARKDLERQFRAALAELTAADQAEVLYCVAQKQP